MKLYFDLLISIGIIGTLLPALVLIYSSIKRKNSWEWSHPKQARTIASILLIGTGTFLYGSFLEPNFLITTYQTIDIEGIEKPIRIALIADLQIGTYKKDQHVTKVVNRIISLHPDMVLIAGDTVDNVTMDTDETIYLEPLKKLIEEGIPTYAVHGNHEYGIGGGKSLKDQKYRTGNVSAHVQEMMSDLGIVYLTNEYVTTTVQNQDIAIFGGDSYWAGKLSFDSLRNKDEKLPTLGLFHNPAAAWIAAKQDIDLTLFGHTHGGQIRFPFIGPLGRVDDIVPASWYQGLNDVDDDTQIYVTSGAGQTGTRARLFNPPEVVLITLE